MLMFALSLATLVSVSCCFGASAHIERIARPVTVLLIVAMFANFAFTSNMHA